MTVAIRVIDRLQELSDVDFPTFDTGDFLQWDGAKVVGAAGGGGIGGSTGGTDNAILRADGTGGATLQNSSVIIDDSGNVVITQATGVLGIGGLTDSFAGVWTRSGSPTQLVLGLANRSATALFWAQRAYFSTTAGGTASAYIDCSSSGQISVSANGKIGFTNGAGADTAPDSAFGRNAAAVIEINNGTAGQWGALKAGVRDGGTNTVVNGATLGHQSTGTPAAGIGIALLLNLNSSTTADQQAARFLAAWTTATHASRTARASIEVEHNAAGLVEVARFMKEVGAGLTGFWLWDADNNQLEQVSVGAADSGGAGFKVLRLPN